MDECIYRALCHMFQTSMNYYQFHLKEISYLNFSYSFIYTNKDEKMFNISIKNKEKQTNTD